jgi:ligand-binding SRPBCC domain-containing protein
MKTFMLDSQIWLPRPIDEVFAFFSNAMNLEILTPPFVNFHVLTPEPIVMNPGTRLQYRIGLHGIPVKWESEITLWEPPNRFVDDQVRGPYRCWHHEHKFASRDGDTEVTDHVEYSVWGGALVHKLLVERDLQKIFGYRSKKLAELFPKEKTERATAPQI